MSWRRGIATSVTVVLLSAATTTAANAASAVGVGISAGGSASAPQVSTGSVTLSVTSSSDAAVYTVTFQGGVVGHGWTYDGTLTGTGDTWPWAASLTDVPTLTMTTSDGLISGRCGAGSNSAVTDANAALDMQFGCVLSRSGGTPWEVTLDSALTDDSAGGGSPGTWSGSYVEAQAAVPQLNVGTSPTYGAVQLGDATTPDGYIEYGPLRFSGQIDIGGQLYRGDLVSGTSAGVRSQDIPPLDVSGSSSDGTQVTGTCSATYDEVVGQVEDAYEMTCNLALGTAAPVTVSLKTVFTDGTGACSYRDCWGDSSGWFTAG